MSCDYLKGIGTRVEIPHLVVVDDAFTVCSVVSKNESAAKGEVVMSDRFEKSNEAPLLRILANHSLRELHAARKTSGSSLFGGKLAS